ncbi:hypothetical protein E3N88_05673 [Mikania micrantha]|uniref:Uncharacterized protein n=1 Tax=Mikania micrantha TaxID=192012 RepID=A0A5N6PNQ4_9ASTR|nr:hypothetical protein E3N88_05673 [Mikania micrantha]
MEVFLSFAINVVYFLAKGKKRRVSERQNGVSFPAIIKVQPSVPGGGCGRFSGVAHGDFVFLLWSRCLVRYLGFCFDSAERFLLSFADLQKQSTGSKLLLHGGDWHNSEKAVKLDCKDSVDVIDIVLLVALVILLIEILVMG